MKKNIILTLGLLFGGVVHAQSPSVIGAASIVVSRVRNGSTGSEIAFLSILNSDAVSWSPCGRYVAFGVGRLDGVINVYTYDGADLTLLGSEAFTSEAFTTNILGLDWSPDGNYLVAVGGATTKVYEFLPTLDVPNVLNEVASDAASMILRSVDWSNDGVHIVVSNCDTRNADAADVGDDAKELKIFSFDGASLTQIAGVDCSDGTMDAVLINSVRFTPDGTFVASGGTPKDGAEIHVFAFNPDAVLESDRLIEVATAVHGKEVASVDWSPNGQYLAIGGNIAGILASDIRIYEFVDESLLEIASVPPLHGDTARVNSVAWYPDGKNIAAGSDEAPNQLQSYAFDGTSLTLNFSVNNGSTVNEVAMRKTDLFDVNVAINDGYKLLVNEICPILPDGSCDPDYEGTTKFSGSVGVCGPNTRLLVNTITPVDEQTGEPNPAGTTCFTGRVGADCLLMTNNIMPIKDCKENPCGSLCLYGCVTARKNFKVLGNFSKPSDERIKQHITPIDARESLAAISALQPQRYDYSHDWLQGTGIANTTQRGFIAQEVAKVLPELVHVDESFAYGDGTIENLHSIDYSQLVVDLVGAMQALNAELSELETLAALQNK